MKIPTLGFCGLHVAGKIQDGAGTSRSEPADILQVHSRGRSASLADLEPSLHSPYNHSQASLYSGDRWNMESQMQSLHSYMRSLPTKSDFEHYVSRIEQTYRQEIMELKKDLGVCMEDIEGNTEGICNTLQSHEETPNSHTVMLQQFMYHQDDIENCNRWNNIGIRGIPETIEHKDFVGAVIFNHYASNLRIPILS